MKKVLLLVIAAAFLAPAAAGAVTFNNISGTASMTVNLTSFNSLDERITEAISFVNGSNRGIITGIAGDPNAFFIEDHFTFTGEGNDAELIVRGNLLAVSNNRISGPASFTLFSPATVSLTGKTTITEIEGAAKVNVVANNGRAGLRMSLQPSSVVFNTYSSGAFTRTERLGDAAIRIPATAKTFTNVSAVTLPPGFGE